MDAGVEKAKGRQRTTLGDALTGVTTLFKTSYTLGDITNVLGEVSDAIETSTKTNGAITGAKGALAKINVLKQATQILQGEIATATAQASTRFAASSVQYALKRKMAQEKFETKQHRPKQSRLSDSYKSLKGVVDLTNIETPAAAVLVRDPLERSVKRAEERLYAPPKNGSVYSPAEVIEISEALTAKQFTEAKKTWVERRLVYCTSLRALNMMIHGVKVLHKPTPIGWGKVGRPPLLDNIDVTRLVADIASQKSDICDNKAFTEALNKQVRDKSIAAGHTGLGVEAL